MIRSIKKRFDQKKSYIWLRDIYTRLRVAGYRGLSDEEFVLKDFRYVFGYDLDIMNPKGYHEVMAWYKSQHILESLTLYADKYSVREYVAESIGEEHLIPMLDVWETVDDINLDSLPDKYVLMPSHLSGMKFIQDGTVKVNRPRLRRQLRYWLGLNYYDMTREQQYRDIQPRILVMKYMEDDTHDLTDYKYMVIDGEIEFIVSIMNRKTKMTYAKTDRHWQPKNIGAALTKKQTEVTRPARWKEMEAAALKLAEGFPFVRVDLYVVEGTIYFGELTFTPGDSRFRLMPESYNDAIGKMIYDALKEKKHYKSVNESLKL